MTNQNRQHEFGGYLRSIHQTYCCQGMERSICVTASTDHLTPAWLTTVLRTHGSLVRGSVTTLHILSTFETAPSRLVRFAATYTPDAFGTAPSQFFLKLPRPETLEPAQRERHFYTTLAPLLPTHLLIPWYCVGTTEAEVPYILLGDVSLSHRVWDQGLPPWPILESMVTALARLHAAMWERSNLETLIGEASETTLTAMFVHAEQRYEELATNLGSHLTANHTSVLERYLTQAPPLFRTRLQRRKALTLCHPDNHHENFLLSQQGADGVYLIDWQVYRCWWGGVDLAAVITRSVSSALQHQADALLRVYHQRLQAYGITNYTWNDCWDDYRLGVIDTMRVILSMRRRPQAALNVLRPLLREWERCGCAELLSG